MKSKIMKGFYYIQDDNHQEIIVKADNMKKAVEKYVGKMTFLQGKLITDTKHYVSYLFTYPRNEYTPETNRVIKARTVLYFS